MNVSAQLKTITSNIMQVQGQFKMSNENQLKEKHESIMYKYRKSMSHAKGCFEKLVEVQKKTFKQLTAVDIAENN